jgi:hypothetical protein
MVAMAGRKLEWIPGGEIIESSHGALVSKAYPVVVVAETRRKGKDNIERDEIQVGIVADNGRLWTVYPSKGMLQVVA